jgi:hypothetical protein
MHVLTSNWILGIFESTRSLNSHRLAPVAIWPAPILIDGQIDTLKVA